MTATRGSRRAEAAGLALLAGRTLVVSDPRTGDEGYVGADGEVVRKAAAWRLM